MKRLNVLELMAEPDFSINNIKAVFVFKYECEQKSYTSTKYDEILMAIERYMERCEHNFLNPERQFKRHCNYDEVIVKTYNTEVKITWN